MSSGFLQIRRNNRTGQRIVRAGSNFLRNRNIVARQKVRNAVSAGVAGVSALVKRFGRTKFFSGKGKPPRKLLAGRSKAYTADPTNAITTNPGGGMTSHSMTIRMGSRKDMVRKLVKDSKESVVFRFGALQPFNNTTLSGISPITMNGGGAYTLTNWISLAASGTGAFSQYVPVHVYDLTSTTNFVNNSVINSIPAMALVYRGTSATAGIYPVNQIDFTPMNGRIADGTTAAAAWQVERSAHQSSAAATYPMSSAIQEWTQIKMLCYGAKTRSTRFKIQVVQLRDEKLSPLEVSETDWTAPGPTSGFDTLGQIVNFWTGLASSSYKHPIASSSSLYKRNLKVIKEYDFIVDPTTTIEERPDVGHSKALNIFIPMYRRNNYESQATGLESNTADQDNFTTEIAKPEVYLKPKARVYLIVQATNPVITNAGVTISPDTTPSYDLVIRNKFSQLS